MGDLKLLAKVSAPTRGPKRSSTFDSTKQPELRFRASLTEKGSDVHLTLS